MTADDFAERHYLVLRPSQGVDNNWHVVDAGDGCVAHCYGFAHDIRDGRYLAERIAAALNYCKGIPTALLLENSTKTACSYGGAAGCAGACKSWCGGTA